ncbi:MAG: prepilin peptidase [Lachnospiraceae bacterium]|nr:prepilin peptidase [Lachnospiraceae bacterium]
MVVFIFYFTVFIYGIVIGSFLNVCIYRLPLQENIVTTRSHCMKCGYQLRWYDLVPLFSYLFLGGKCRKCKEKISVQYPVIEALNGVFYVLIVAECGVTLESLLYCLLFSALIVLSVIDFRTYEIPVGINWFIAALGVVRVVTDYQNWLQYIIGMICVSGFLLLIYWVTKGRGIGGGDIKLMAASGLLLGWQQNLLAFTLGCIIGSVIHLIRMRISEEGNVLALGPYLAAGIAISALWGPEFINWYVSLYAI